MNRLEPEILTLRDSVRAIEACLIINDERGKDVEKTQEQLEHRVSVLEDLCALTVEGLEQRVQLAEQNVEILNKNLNDAITRINELHKWLNSFTDKDLRCYEKLDDSVDGDGNDDEFDFSDYDDKVTEEIVRVQQMNDNPE